MHTILFVSLAKNQTLFYSAIGQKLEHYGFNIVHVCFDEDSVIMLKELNHRVYNPFDMQPQNAEDIMFSDYGIDDASMLINHEKSKYGVRNTKVLVRKFKGHLYAMDKILNELSKEKTKVTIVQELGGFTPVLAAFYAAKRKCIHNCFIEPSFFKGRVFFTFDTLSSPKINFDSDVDVNNKVKTILNQILSSKEIVVPVKDKAHYREIFSKIFDLHNFKRLVEKLVSKYIHRRKEEFNHIGKHVYNHIRMLANYVRLKKYYKVLDANNYYIYYPLHVSADFALTIRSPEYLDQYAFIDYLCRIAPLGCRVLVKEHPALIGDVSFFRIKELINSHDNLTVLYPSTNNHDVLSSSSAVITINSKSGAEALLHKKQVLVMGDAFYSDSKLVHYIENISDLKVILLKALLTNANIQESDLYSYFQSVWNSSYEGDLYDLSSANVDNFSNELREVLGYSLSK